MRYEHNACVMNKRVVNESARNDSDGMKRSEREKRDIITPYSNFKLQTSSPAEEEEGKTETLIRRSAKTKTTQQSLTRSTVHYHSTHILLMKSTSTGPKVPSP